MLLAGKAKQVSEKSRNKQVLFWYDLTWNVFVELNYGFGNAVLICIYIFVFHFDL